MESSSHQTKSGETEEDPGGVVSCSKCNFEERYHYKGKKPPFAKSFVFLEDAYIMKDPFSPPGKGQCLMIAGDCSMCNKSVCCSSECSIFYVKRFCMSCVRKNLGYFPPLITNKIKKS